MFLSRRVLHAIARKWTSVTHTTYDKHGAGTVSRLAAPRLALPCLGLPYLTSHVYRVQSGELGRVSSYLSRSHADAIHSTCLSVSLMAGTFEYPVPCH